MQYLCYKDLNRQIKNNFLKDVIESWAKINYDPKINMVSNESIWNNSKIKISNSTIFNKSWYDKGVTKIKHLYDVDNEQFYSFNTFKNLYGIENKDFLQYYSLLSNIPQQWKNNIKLESQQIQPYLLINNIMKIKKPNKYLYKKYLEKHNTSIINKAEQKWNSEFENLDWKSIYITPFKSTIESKLRVFQYKYVTRILPTNKFLHQIHLVDSSLCDFCTMQVETLRHIFWECPHIQHFWSHLDMFFASQNFNVTLNYQNISFGYKYISNDQIMSIVNFIIILAKFFIFKNKLNHTTPMFEVFVCYLRKRKEVERHIAIIKDKIATHNKKWDQIQL